MRGAISNYEYDLKDDGFDIGEFIADVSLTPEEAIELAKAILSYYGVNHDS